MSWKTILKIQVRGFQDARRLGNEYATKEMYESRVIDSYKYNLLSDAEKMRYHDALARLLDKYGNEDEWAKETKKFHRTMDGRLRRKTGKRTFSQLSDVPAELPKRKDNRPRKTKKEARNYGDKQDKRRKRGKLIGPLREGSAYAGYRRRGQTASAKRVPSQRTKYMKDTEKRRQLITDYFTLYQKRFNREPTLQEIKDEEGRPLTSFEEESYYRMKNR